MILTHIVSFADSAKTVKHILKNRLELSERLVKRLKYADQVFCNNIPVHVDFCVKTGDTVKAVIEFDEANEDIIPENTAIDIIFEDEYLISLNKPAGIVMHPTAGHYCGTLANALAHHYQATGRKTLIRPVSRLDRDTSGVVVFAGNQYIQEKLVKQMKTGIYKKEYFGIVHGIVASKKGTISLPVGRKPGSIMLRHITPDGLPSVTNYEVLEYLNNATFVKFQLETGRTHQIRVHCQAAGHPLIGDTLYPCSGESGSQPATETMQRQALHSSRTVFRHPVEGRAVELYAPLPQDIKNALEILRN